MAAIKLPGDAVAFERVPLPKRFCNLERLLFALEARGLDGIVATLPYNAFYLTGFNAIAHKADEPRPYAVILSRHARRCPCRRHSSLVRARPRPPSCGCPG